MNHADSESVNAGASSFHFPWFWTPFLTGGGIFLSQIIIFEENFERTASWQFEIRNLRSSVVSWAFRLFFETLSPDVTGTVCPCKNAILSKFKNPNFSSSRPSPAASRAFLSPLVLPSRAACIWVGLILYMVRSTLLPGGSEPKFRSKK